MCKIQLEGSNLSIKNPYMLTTITSAEVYLVLYENQCDVHNFFFDRDEKILRKNNYCIQRNLLITYRHKDMF